MNIPKDQPGEHFHFFCCNVYQEMMRLTVNYGLAGKKS
jgi:hypothetical protein